MPDHIPRDVLIAYDTRFRARFGMKAPINRGKDAAIAKWLLTTYEWPQIEELMDIFFASHEPFYERAGYSLGVFKACLPQVIAARARRQPAAAVEVDEDALAKIRRQQQAEAAAHLEDVRRAWRERGR